MKTLQKHRLVYSLIFGVSLLPAVPCTAQPKNSELLEKAYREYEMIYWTLRRIKQDETALTDYGSQLSPGNGGSVIATVPNIHTEGKFERPLPIFPQEDPEKYITNKYVKPLLRQEFFDALKSRVTESRSRSVLILIHGYDYDFDETAYRAGQFLHDSGFDGTLVLFSWPSFGELGGNGYFADTENAMMSIPGLVDFLSELTETVPEASFNILAHSLGCRIASQALTVMDASNGERNVPLFDQLILAAPDVDYEAFVQVSAQAVRRSSVGVTVYVSQRDQVLQISRAFHGDRRRLGDASDAPVVMEGFDVVDVTNVDSQSRPDLGHMYVFDSLEVMKDIVQILNGDPITERGLPNKSNAETSNTEIVQRLQKL